MAYRSQMFSALGDRRRQAAGAASADPGAPAAAAAPAGAAGDPGGQGDVGGVGGLRAFFQANQGQGEQMLSGLADRINQRVSDAAGQARGAVDTTMTRDPYGGGTVSHTVDPTRLGDAQTAMTGAQGDARAFSSGDLSGLQSLLPQSSSTGMGRSLDAWLMQGAMGQIPALAQGVQDNAEAAQRRVDGLAGSVGSTTRANIGPPPMVEQPPAPLPRPTDTAPGGTPPGGSRGGTPGPRGGGTPEFGGRGGTPGPRRRPGSGGRGG